MSDNHTYKKIEITGSSPKSKTLRNLEWFEVVDTRGHIVNGDVAHYQVTLKIGMLIQSDH